ncbi:small ribosomal subunit protein uS13c-like [Malania oleifera]|uniref:small ribosomal subunit protein uS13c-like n=1 Tax=Malania oleifera TaxID=397392 RepID=UPI0025AE2EF8|nr:small ribosomal subunit protein uS13c-like [Malania oleifera]XP_057979732.1 small ribosomal subunit protein uS13c-like [Malania oleifera]
MIGSVGSNTVWKMTRTLAMHLAPAISSARNSNPLSIAPTFLGQSIRSINVKTFSIPDNKRLEFSLQYIHGIGRRRAHQILCSLSIENKLSKDLTPRERFILGEELDRYMIDRELKQFNHRAIERLKQIQCYRGIRHEQGLPCRGQRTHTNARTLRGKAIPIEGKKKPGR